MTAPAPSPGLRIGTVPRNSLAIVSGLVGLSSGLAGCAGIPIRFQDRLGSELNGYPSWSQIIEAERESMASVSAMESPDSNEQVPERPRSFSGWTRDSLLESTEIEDERRLDRTSRPASLIAMLFGNQDDGALAASESGPLPDEVHLGMSEREVLDAWGEPREVEVAGSGASGAHRYIYPTSVLEGLGEERIIYFEDGRVAGWETVRR